MSEAEAATMAEMLALADAVRGDSGGGGGGTRGTGVDFVLGQEEAVAALEKALGPKYHNDTASWSADNPNQLVRVSLPPIFLPQSMCMSHTLLSHLILESQASCVSHSF